MDDLVSKARAFAASAHGRLDHRRKYTFEPYVVHLQAVADLVASVSDDPDMLAAAWLHDTVEDTDTTLADLEHHFGTTVAGLVSDLTDISRPADGNRAVRKSIDRSHLANASQRAKTIKLADLIHNCRDICSHDAEFAKIYCAEMATFMEVLQDGDATLYSQAMDVLHSTADALNLPLHVAGKPAEERPLFPLTRMANLFRQTFTARHIAHALPSVDQPAAETVLTIMAQQQVPVVGIRQHGIVQGYVSREEPQRVQRILPEQILSDNASFSEIILALNRHPCCFVSVLGAIGGVIIKEDVQHPYMRMWLFGIITMLEMETEPLIERIWPSDTWKPMVSEGRLAKAEALLAERKRRNQRSNLLACLQFSDKMQLLLEDEGFFQTFAFPSKKAARTICKELESLRNNLAHAQDIISHDFAQVARIAQRIESLRGG